MSLTPQIKRYVARQLQEGGGETAPSAWIASGSDIAYTQGNVGIGVAPPAYQLDVGGDLNIAGVYRIGGTTVLTASSLGSGVTSSSLTSVGTIGTGVWQGTAIANAYIATGLDVTKLTVGTTLPSNVVTSSLTAVGTISTGVWQGTAITDTYLATISTAGKVSNSATTATSANTPNAIVARDASGNFSAGTITATFSGNLTGDVTGNVSGNAGTVTNGVYTTGDQTIGGTKTFSSTIVGSINGNAATATALQTARTINGVSFDGTANITVAAAAGTLTGTTLASNVVSSSLTSVGTLTNLTVTNPITGSVTGSSGSTTGNAATATALSSARTFALTGDITGSVSSDLTSGASISTAIAAGVIVDADINASAAIADTKLATISTAGKVANSATTATASNTPSTIVLRDGSGNFAAGAITATGLTATTLTEGTSAVVVQADIGSGPNEIPLNQYLGTMAYQDAAAITVRSIATDALTASGLVTFASLKGTGATTVTTILDEDNMASDSATALATQQSIKAYVDAQVTASDSLSEVLAIGNTTGANDIVVNSGQKIRTPAVAAQDGTASITIANSTGALTLNAALADSNLATISTVGKVANSATTATSANTANAIVARDASNNFSAGTITAELTGNASTATTLQTARNINGVSFNGSADITVTAAAGTLTGTTLASNVVTSSLTSVGTLTDLTVTNPITGSITGSSGSTTGNAATATKLATARNINSVAFDGTADITVTAAAGTLTGSTLASGVTASSLTSVGTLGSLAVSGTATIGTVAGTTITEGGSAVVRQTDIGSAPNEVPLNQYLGTMAYQDSAAINVGTVTANTVTATTITGALTGNAATATALSSARTFALTGDITGSVSSDLASGFSISTDIAAGAIVNADISASAAIVDTKLATISTAGKVANSATTATNANTASTIVARDASGNFSAGTISASALTSSGLVTFASLKGTGAVTVTDILDEDNMASNSATALATQQSIKAYVDSQVTAAGSLSSVLAAGNTTGANDIVVSSGQKITTNTIDETTAGSGVTIDSVLLKDDVVNATDIETGTISANDGTTSVTIADSTGRMTIAAAPIMTALTGSRPVFTDSNKGLTSNAITGTGNVVMSASPTLTGTITADTIVTSGRVGVGTSAPQNYDNSADNLVIYEDSSDAGSGITIASGATKKGSIYFADGTTTPGQGKIVYDHSADEMVFSANNETHVTITKFGNVCINAAAAGTSAQGVLTLGNATVPASGPADTVQIYSVDRSAGNTIPAIYCEGSGVTNAGITNTTVTHKIALSVNGTVYYLLATTNAT